MDEQQLLSRLRRGDERALAAVIARFSAYVVTVIHNRSRGLLSPEDEDELASSTFFALWQSCRTVKAGSIRAWLGSVARNKTVDRLRKARMDMPLDEELAGTDDFLLEETVKKEQARQLREAVALLHGYSDERFKLVEDLETSVDRYEDKLGTYLVKVTEREMTAKQNAEVSKFLHTISDFERISDHALNIAEGAKELHEKNLSFSEAAAHELEVMEAALTEILSTAIRSFVNNDLQLAARVEPLEELIDNLCDEMKLHHVDRLQKGLCTLGQGFVFNDLLTNYERVADHCSNIAVALIELESDSFDTHEYLNSLKELKSDMYERYYEEYRRVYQL